MLVDLCYISPLFNLFQIIRICVTSLSAGPPCHATFTLASMHTIMPRSLLKTSSTVTPAAYTPSSRSVPLSRSMPC